ncbi:MAG: hemolysin III family protein [Planctomycetes bacterium]|nr:hemolysin III family protein [Planctomycetota bacterium]
MRNCTHEFAREEFANCLTHGGGLLFALVGAVILFDAVAENANDALRFACWIYALAMVAVYAISTLSHLFENPARRHFFRRLDQGVIFLFIVGSFTPFAIVYLQGEMRWILLVIMWAGALIGFCSKVFWGHRVESPTVMHYLALSWLPVTVIVPILQSLPTYGIIWCFAGGMCYTVGTVFLSLDTKVRYFHALWHLFVIAGSYCHFRAIVNYVIPLES